MGWQPIETAPKDGTPVDLFIVGTDDTVDFYCDGKAKFNRESRKREGVTKGWAWLTYGINEPKWRAYELPECMPLSPDVTPTHWMPLPLPPTSA